MRAYLGLILVFSLCLSLASCRVHERWEQCYGEPADPRIEVKRVDTILEFEDGEPYIDTVITTEFLYDINEEAVYEIELWHEETGQKIRYHGDRGVCQNVVLKEDNRTLEDKYRGCPTLGKNLLHFRKPLHRNEGLYEMTVKIVDDEETMCVVTGIVHGIDPKEKETFRVTNNVDSQNFDEASEPTVDWSPDQEVHRFDTQNDLLLIE